MMPPDPALSPFDLPAPADTQSSLAAIPARLSPSAGPPIVATPGAPAVVRIVSGPGQGGAARLGDAPLVLGREAGSDLMLPDPKASRRHARIEKVEGSWVLTDLGSTNGTRLNGVRVSRAGIAPGDLIYVGDTVIAVQPAPPIATG
jgi:pSer/pThr/pTyr-binding forkhead associated (FHA) protein